MKTKTLLVLLSVVALFLLAGCPQVNPPGACTQEARQCPDGSYVGRTGPNCEFAACPNTTNCQNYSVDKYPSQCVICPPCAACSSISCQSEEFCNNIGFNRSWYNETANPNCKCPQGYIQKGDVCNPDCYYTTPKCLRPSIHCNTTQHVEEEACIIAGGNVTTQLCCKSVGDFPNTCSIGACGCSPENSHEVKVCDCGQYCWYSYKSQCINPPPQGNTTAESSSVVNASNQFALELYSQYASQDGNIFFSPYSISTALAMTYEGARGKTAEEMQSVFHFPLDNNTRRAGFAAIYSEINRKDKKYNLSTANALWAQKDYKFLDSYFNLISTYYGGSVTNLDFIGDTENSRITINKWVEEQTNHKIKDILPPASITELTRLVLTNAVYFKANWFIPFLNETTEQDFRVNSTKTIKVKMMSLDGDMAKTSSGELVSLRFNYAETDEAQILELFYDGNETSMLILLPKADNLRGLEQLLNANKLNEWKAMLKETKLDGVYLPRFKFETKYFMPKTLKDMGMKNAFDPNKADFSGMDGTKNLFISDVIHQAFIDVNETGTEAAAATAVIVNLGMAPGEPKVFRADHPFIFIIQQKNTGNILFIGRVSNPNG
ncbi:serpin family protein [Candidatus Micrarchaeota archaeon]|nr:serpin family protein [Candidatus Micrarchaeota archaeon]